MFEQADFYEQLAVRAATIDELLSDDFEALPGQKGHANLAAQRLAVWCRSCASGDWLLFSRRLQRDGLSISDVLARFATVRRKASAPTPLWIVDARWIDAALQDVGREVSATTSLEVKPCPFEHLFTAVVTQAESRLRESVDARTLEKLSDSARACLRHSLLRRFSALCAPALYEHFSRARNLAAKPANVDNSLPCNGNAQYQRFVAEMKASGFRRLFEEKPILLRLLASIARQWIDASREFLVRFEADFPTFSSYIPKSGQHCRIAKIEDELSDPHNGGRSVMIVTFEDGFRLVYKPRSLQGGAAWHALVERLNLSTPPIALKAARSIAREGYGWTEFVAHEGCVDETEIKQFFRRAGAWLALLHCFAGGDMHQENMIASGPDPVPIDLETILQMPQACQIADVGSLASQAAEEIVANSIMSTGLLPSYAKTHDNNIFAIGGIEEDLSFRTRVYWDAINSDAMRPGKIIESNTTSPNLPHLNGQYAKIGDHLETFVSGFEDYARFLAIANEKHDALFQDFAGVQVRKVLRPTRFYHMLLQRLRDHRTMSDGVSWSAQTDFVARLADWENDLDPLWALQRAERIALATLNVPYFMSLCDQNKIADATGISISVEGISGLERARERVKSLDERAIAWQAQIVRQNMAAASRSKGSEVTPEPGLSRTPADLASHEIFVAEADKIAAEVSDYAIRKGTGAAWIGLDWLGDSEVSHLLPLGFDLYGGNAGIAVFLAAHGKVRGCASSADLALRAIAHLRKELQSRNAARIARSLGLGGATGLGSIVYSLAVVSELLGDDSLLASALAAAELVTEDLIAADKQLDVFGGSAGGILGLLRLHRDTGLRDVLNRATRCGEHLLVQERGGTKGFRTWRGQGSSALNGMAHGAAGYAYALGIASGSNWP